MMAWPMRIHVAKVYVVGLCSMRAYLEMVHLVDSCLIEACVATFHLTQFFSDAPSFKKVPSKGSQLK